MFKSRVDASESRSETSGTSLLVTPLSPKDRVPSFNVIKLLLFRPVRLGVLITTVNTSLGWSDTGIEMADDLSDME